MQRWKQVRVEVAADEVDTLSGALWSAGAAGLEERPASIGDRCTLLVAVPADRLASVVDALGGLELTVADVDPEAGLDTWRQYARQVEAGGFLVQPAWATAVVSTPALPAAGGPGGGERRCITLDPGRSFGSGSHVTTQLMLEAVARFAGPGSRVLDVGCGSGVLSVAAALAGAAWVRAVDIDPHAVEVTIANAARNGVAERVDCDDTSVDRIADAFDLVLANVTAAALVDLAAPLVSRVAPGGRLVLSGLLDEQTDQVVAAYLTAALQPVERHSRDGWSILVLSRPATDTASGRGSPTSGSMIRDQYR